jgi:hypothetical protein
MFLRVVLMFRVVIIADGLGTRNAMEIGDRKACFAPVRETSECLFAWFRRAVVVVRRLLDFVWRVLYASGESRHTPEIRTTQNGTVNSI